MDLFDGLTVDYGEPKPSLSKARRLVGWVEVLAEIETDFKRECHDVAFHARMVGAHSVARACRWLGDPRTLERHGYDAMHARAERIAHAWLRRIETRA